MAALLNGELLASRNVVVWGGTGGLNAAQSGFDRAGELLATNTLDPFNELLHPAIGPNAESDALLRHGGMGRNQMLTRFQASSS
jgi:hypothetical protein